MPAYPQMTTLLDVTIPSLGAKETLTLNAQGFSGSTNYNTTGAPTTTTANPYAVEVVTAEITSPTDVNGDYESIAQNGGEIWFLRNGATSLQNIVNLPVGGWINMAPPIEQGYGGRTHVLAFGESFLSVCMSNYGPQGKRSSTGGNMPLRNTTLKYVGDFAVSVNSQEGWTGAGNGGLRIVLKGLRYTLEQLKALAAYYNPEVTEQSGARMMAGLPPVSLTHNAPGFSRISDFQKLAGGSDQGTTQIDPYINFAYNAVATTSSQPFVMSQATVISGAASGHTPDQYQDLGFPFAESGDIAIIRRRGIQVVSRPSNLQRVGWRIGGSDYPENNGGAGAGEFVSDRVNDLVFGDPGYYVPNGQPNGQLGLYQELPRVQGDYPLILAGVNAAPFIAANGTPIPASSVVVGLNGVLIRKS